MCNIIYFQFRIPKKKTNTKSEDVQVQSPLARLPGSHHCDYPLKEVKSSSECKVWRRMLHEVLVLFWRLGFFNAKCCLVIIINPGCLERDKCVGLTSACKCTFTEMGVLVPCFHPKSLKSRVCSFKCSLKLS